MLGLGTRFEEMETNWRPGDVPRRRRELHPGRRGAGRARAQHHGVDGDHRRRGCDGGAAGGSAPNPGRAGTGCVCAPASTRGSTTRSTPSTPVRGALPDDGPDEPAGGIRTIRLASRVTRRSPSTRLPGPAHRRRRPVLPGVRAAYHDRPSSFYGMGFATPPLPAASVSTPTARRFASSATARSRGDDSGPSPPNTGSE